MCISNFPITEELWLLNFWRFYLVSCPIKPGKPVHTHLVRLVRLMWLIPAFLVYRVTQLGVTRCGGGVIVWDLPAHYWVGRYQTIAGLQLPARTVVAACGT